MALKKRATRYRQKNRNISRYQTTNLVKTWLFLLASKAGQKRDKSEFENKFVEIKPGANRLNMSCNMLYNMLYTMFERFEQLF